MKNVPTYLSNLKIKVDKLDVDKQLPVPVDLCKLNDVVKNDVVREKDVHNAKIKNIEDKIPEIINLTTKTVLNDKINLATKTAFNVVENKIPSVSNLVKKTATQKLMKLKIKLMIIILINILLIQNLII